MAGGRKTWGRCEIILENDSVGAIDTRLWITQFPDHILRMRTQSRWRSVQTRLAIDGRVDKPTVTYVWLSAIDGTILKTHDEAAKLGFGDGLVEADVLNRKAISLPQPAYHNPALFIQVNISLLVLLYPHCQERNAFRVYRGG